MRETGGQKFSRFLRSVLVKRSSLRGRMTISYVAVTLGSVFTFMLLVILTSGVLSAVLTDTVPSTFVAAVQQQAQFYALNAAVQAQGATLDARTNFVPGTAHALLPAPFDPKSDVYQITIPYIPTASVNPASIPIALLVSPDGHLLASSYPARYPAGMPISALLPEQIAPIEQALAGHSNSALVHLSLDKRGYVAGSGASGTTSQVYAAVPVWSADHRPIGAFYLLAPAPDRTNLFAVLKSVLIVNLALLVLVTPVGVFFGWITTRGMVRRVQRLVTATTQFAAGDYTQRVASAYPDEIGRLERQFNQMAEQLLENIAHRQQLAGQNARLEERSRISRELHDAISQDLFSLRMLADGLQEATRSGSSPTDLRPHITMLEQTTSNMTREMRALLLELRPSQLEDLGLSGALKSLAHAYSIRLGMTVTADVRPVRLDVKGEHALLRIAQEALANAARHSSASLISLSLAERDGQVCLTVRDNGEGFCWERESVRHGLGLHLMQERVEELHGTFDLQTAPDQGTRITVCLPLEDACDYCCAGR